MLLVTFNHQLFSHGKNFLNGLTIIWSIPVCSEVILFRYGKICDDSIFQKKVLTILMSLPEYGPTKGVSIHKKIISEDRHITTNQIILFLFIEYVIRTWDFELMCEGVLIALSKIRK